MRLADMAEKVPRPLKRPLRNIYGIVKPSIISGREFRETYGFLMESQWWSRERLEEYQLEQLSRLLNHAYDNVPYYRRVFNERGLKPKDIQDFSDLEKLPYLTKDDFREHFGELVATNIDVSNLPISHSSGTSGKPLQFYEDHSSRQKELAFIFNQWSRVGYEPGDRRVELRGPVMQGKKPFEHDFSSRVLRLSPRMGNVETVKYYLEKIRDFRSGFLHGYPSAIAELAHFIKEYGLAVPFKLKAVLFASEAVYDWEREIVGDVFDCRVFSHYGLAEKVTLAAECEYSTHYHCFPQYGITEIDRASNEIIGTSLINYVNPFIRYRTTDIATGIASHCDYCKREYSPIFKQVEGRVGDYIVTSRGLVGPAAMTFLFNALRYVKDTQIVQKDLNHTVLRVVPWYTKEKSDYMIEVEQLRQGLLKLFGDDMRIEIEETEEIELAESGKFRWIISDVSRGRIEKRTT